MSEVEARWELYTSHVKVNLREAKDEVQMVDFIDRMVKYLEEQKDTKSRVADFRKDMIQYMAKEIVSRSLHSNTPGAPTPRWSFGNEGPSMKHRKTAVYDLEEECLIASRKDMVKIEQWIGHRNNQLIKTVPYRLAR
jgi:hypothetical protein